MAADTPTIHASAVLIGPKAALICGPSGAGKSKLAWQILHSALPFTRLVGDDRLRAEARSGRLLLRPAGTLAGLIEMHGLGVRRVPHEPLAVAGYIVDLAAADAERLPPEQAQKAVISGVTLPRLAIAAGADALQIMLAFLGTVAGGH